MLRTFENGQGATYVDDGVYAEAKQTEEMQRALAGSKRNTNDAEGYFGLLKYYISQFGTLSKYLADAVIAAERDELFPLLAPQYEMHAKQRVSDADASKATLKRRAKYQGRDGRLSRLAPELKLEVLDFAHHEGKQLFLADAKRRDDAADAADLARRERDVDAAGDRQVWRAARGSARAAARARRP